MRFRACELYDAQKPRGAEANMAKLLAAKASWEAANACLQTHGGFGFARDYDSRVRGLASHFVWTNLWKESLTLDVKHPEARNILGQLIDRAEVLVQNLAPAAADQLGPGYGSLGPAHPRLVVCDISGYGSTGPMSTRRPTPCSSRARPGSSR